MGPLNLPSCDFLRFGKSASLAGCLAAAGIWIGLASPLHAASRSWTGAVSNVFDTAGNWAGGLPGASDVAVFYQPGASNLNVTTDGTQRIVGGIAFNDDADSDVSLTIISGKVFRNTGDITVSPGSQGTHSIINQGTYRFGQTGEASGTYNYAITNDSAQIFTFQGPIETSGAPTGSTIVRNLTFGGSGAIAMNGSMKNDVGNGQVMNILKSGSGTTTFSATNTYTGTTAVTAGTLLVANSVGSATSTGAVTVQSGATLGGTGRVDPAGTNPVTVQSGGALLGGDGASANGALTVAGNLTLQGSATIKLVLGASLAHSSLARTEGTWTFAAGQQFDFTALTGATTGVYDNIIAGLTADPGVSGWTVVSGSPVQGTFSWDGTNVDFTATTIPEPSSLALAGCAVLGLAWGLRPGRSRKARIS